MKYASAGALSRAITDVLQRETGGDSRRYEQLRRNIAFERVLARLVAEDAEVWLLKGGVALDYRLREARSTLDLDLSSNIDIATFQEKLVRALALDLGDYFEVRLAGEPVRPVDDIDTYRFGLDVRLNDRTFARINIDVGFADPWIGDAETLTSSDVLAFAGVAPVSVKAIPLAQHVAEKLHAYTKTYNGRPRSRVKDLVDLVLLSGYRPMAGTELAAVVRTVFHTRGTHDLPQAFPPPPAGWGGPYRRLSETLPITADVDEGYALVVAFLDPMLAGAAEGLSWDPNRRAWL